MIIQTILDKVSNLETKVKNIDEKFETIKTDSKDESSDKPKEPFPCNSCDFVSKSKTGLKNHCRIKHKTMEGTSNVISGSEHSMDSRSFKISLKLEAYCPECDIIFTYEELLRYQNHCKAEHGWLTTTTNEDCYYM